MKQLLVCVAVALVAAGCESEEGGNPSDPSQVTVQFSTTDITVGTGPQVVAGNRVTVHYTGWLYNPSGPESKGAQFDSSVGSTPLEFVVGSSNIIPGFQQGVLGMQVGGKRRVYMPPNLAYGAAGRPPVIPPNASLVFEIDLLTLVQ